MNFESGSAVMVQAQTKWPTRLSRRVFLGQSGLATLALPLLGSPSMQAGAQPSEALAVSRLNDSMSLFTGAGANVLVKRSGNGELIVVDGGLAEHAEALRDLISESMDSSSFNTLINTHWHRQQTGLNELLGNEDTTIFAHENTRLWLTAEIERPWEDHRFDPLPPQALPNKTFYHYGDLAVDDTSLQYGYMLQAHTDGDMYAFFPADNVLHAGGVVCNDGWPLLDWWTGGWIGGLVDGLETILRVANRDTLIVPADGPVMTYAEVAEMRDMYQTIFQRIRDLFMAARGPQETLDAKPTEEFDDKWGNSDQFVLLAHQSVLAHFAPDA